MSGRRILRDRLLLSLLLLIHLLPLLLQRTQIPLANPSSHRQTKIPQITHIRTLNNPVSATAQDAQ